ncbi:hypothetical protein BH09VER1_BH09VER1_29290 [soil metagenome]
MVKGLDVFHDRFRDFGESFIPIGGAACDQWFGEQGLAFRRTRDLDSMLIVEALNRDFISAFRNFVDEGGYEIRERSADSPILFRFAKPKDERFPVILELFSRSPDVLELAEGQTIIPVAAETDHHSLSAILMDEVYYALLRSRRIERDGIQFASISALIPLKARAWLNLSARRKGGGKVDSGDVDKHRTDVFRLAATLPDEPGTETPPTVQADLSRFLEAFSEASPEWPRIMDALRPIFGGALKPADLRLAIQTYFRL